MRITQKLVGAGVLALVAGCSTLNSINPFASKPKGNLPAPLVELKGSMAVRTAWKLDIGKAQDFAFTPAIIGNTVIAASAEGARSKCLAMDQLSRRARANWSRNGLST